MKTLGKLEPFTGLSNDTFRIDGDHALQNVYAAYRTSDVVKNLFSESQRHINFEIESPTTNLPRLSDACLRVLGKHMLPVPYAMNILERGTYFDAISVELPLDKCLWISEPQYWRNVVLAKTKQRHLTFVKDCNWRALGLSLKYCELIENCPAEYWPQSEMQRLARLIKDEVTVLCINKLQPLRDAAFQKFFLSETDTDYETPTGDISTTLSSISTSEITPREEEEEQESDIFLEAETAEEEQTTTIKFADDKEVSPRRPDQSLANERCTIVSSSVKLQLKRRDSALALAKYEKSEKERIRAEKIAAKAEQLKRRARRAVLHRIREQKIEARLNSPPPDTKPKQKKIKVRGVFDIPISSDETDPEKYVLDRRNPQLLLKHRSKFNYNPNYCHHVDLSIISLFENLVEFSIYFRPGLVGVEYFPRYYNFSQHDVSRLARGIEALHKLRIFRLRESRMDAKKLEIVVHALTKLPELEVVDFGFDSLGDDCGIALKDLITHSSSLRRLELGNNSLGKTVMHHMAVGFHLHSGSFIEYLGLEHNIIGNDGLHWLVAALIKTAHVSHLCLGAISVDSTGISCCVGNELLRHHKPLIDLDLSAIPMNSDAAKEILKGLYNNHIILNIDCRGCDFDFQFELELDTMLKRNRYILKHSFIYEKDHTNEEIEEYYKNNRNPSMLCAEERLAIKQQCLAQRPDEKLLKYGKSPFSDSIDSDIKLTRLGKTDSETSVVVESDDISEAPVEQFEYDANNFSIEEYKEHVYSPGPGNRYNYMQYHMSTRTSEEWAREYKFETEVFEDTNNA